MQRPVSTPALGWPLCPGGDDEDRIGCTPSTLSPVPTPAPSTVGCSTLPRHCVFDHLLDDDSTGLRFTSRDRTPAFPSGMRSRLGWRSTRCPLAARALTSRPS